jgi:hypothetical protein
MAEFSVLLRFLRLLCQPRWFRQPRWSCTLRGASAGWGAAARNPRSRVVGGYQNLLKKQRGHNQHHLKSQRSCTNLHCVCKWNVRRVAPSRELFIKLKFTIPRRPPPAPRGRLSPGPRNGPRTAGWSPRSTAGNLEAYFIAPPPTGLPSGRGPRCSARFRSVIAPICKGV